MWKIAIVTILIRGAHSVVPVLAKRTIVDLMFNIWRCHARGFTGLRRGRSRPTALATVRGKTDEAVTDSAAQDSGELCEAVDDVDVIDCRGTQSVDRVIDKTERQLDVVLSSAQGEGLSM